jgi:hypothetical protein
VDRPHRPSSRLVNKLRDWHRDTNRFSYLSDFERQLNRSLWALLAVALVYIIFQHVLLANVPENFRGGARLGAVGYDLAIAYTGAFTFYVLNIRLPLRRDRRNIYRHLPGLFDQLVRDTKYFRTCLGHAARVEAQDGNTRLHVQEICKRLTLDTLVDAVLPISDSNYQAPVKDVINFNIANTRATCHEILSVSSFLASGVIDHIFAIQHSAFFRKYENDLIRTLREISSPGQPDPWDLSRLAEDMFLNLQTVDCLDKYRQKYLGHGIRPSSQGSRRHVADNL